MGAKLLAQIDDDVAEAGKASHGRRPMRQRLEGLREAAQRVEKYGRPSRDRSRLLERLGALAATPVAVEGEVVAAAQAALGTLNEALEARLGT